MPFYKISFILRSNDAGWQEIFYDQADSFADFTEAEAFNDFSAMYSWRGAGVTLLAKKITEEGGLRRSKIIPLNLECTRGGTGGAKDLPGATCKMRLNFSDGGGRILNVRGVADQDIVGSATGLSTPSAYALGKMNTNLKNHVAAPGNPYLGKVLNPINQAGFEWKLVHFLQQDPVNNNWTEVNIEQQGAPLPVGTLVYFRGIDRTRIPWIQGYYRTTRATSVSAFSIPTQYREDAAITYPRNMQWRIAAYTYPAITDAAFLRVGTRDTAGPFGQSRGARPALRVR